MSAPPVATVSIKDGDRYYLAYLSHGQLARHNNYVMFSIGLTVGKDLRRSTMSRWINAGIVREISHKEWNR